MLTEDEIKIIEGIHLSSERERTILDIADMPHYENVISNFYAYYFDPDEDHGCGKIFLDALQNELGRPDFLSGSIQITREESTEEKKRIDLLLCDQQNRCIIIENKIYHWLANDLGPYWQHAGPGKEKLGVILSLKKEDLEKKWEGKYFPVTHLAMITRVQEKIKEITLKPRQRIFVDDFIQSIKNLYRDQLMNSTVRDYFENKPILAKAYHATLESIDFINAQLKILADHLGMSITARGYSDRRYRHLWYENSREIYYTIVYDKLWNPHEESSIMVIIEIYDHALNSFAQLETVLEFELAHGILRSDNSGKTWKHLLYKTYKVDTDYLSNLAYNLKQDIQNDFDDYLHVLQECLYQRSKLKLHEAMIHVLKTMPDNTGTLEAIADEINKNKLYVRGDGKDVPTYQIRMRAFMSKGKYSSLFEKVDGDGLRLVSEQNMTPLN